MEYTIFEFIILIIHLFKQKNTKSYMLIFYPCWKRTLTSLIVCSLFLIGGINICSAQKKTTDCIKREIFEELNIQIEIKEKLTSILHQYPDCKIKLIPFIAEYLSGELILRDHCDFVLTNKEELNNLDWAEADLPVLKEFLEI